MNETGMKLQVETDKQNWLVTLHIGKRLHQQYLHSPCLKTPIRSDLSASKSHHSAGTSEWSGSGTQTSMSLKEKTKNTIWHYELLQMIKTEAEFLPGL